MLTVVRGMLSSRDSRELHSKIFDTVATEIQSYLIVPEQDTVMRESEMAKSLPSTAPLSFEVTNFTRFSDSILRTLGGISGEYSDKKKKALIMWRALTELTPFLTAYRGGTDISAATVSSALSAVAEMQSAGIAPDTLADMAKSDGLKDDKRLQSKTEDLSRIYTLYKKLLLERFSDTSDGCEATSRKLLEHPGHLCGAKIFIDGFTSFTEPQYRLIVTLAARAEVYVYLPFPKHSEGLFEYSELATANESLKRILRKDGQDIRIKYDSTVYGTPSSIAELSSALWRKSTNFDNITLQNSDEIRIFEASGPFDMCDFVAADIKKRVMAGASYRDFAIIARRAESYKGIIDSSLLDLDIPYFFSYSRDIGEFEAVKLIYTAYSTIRSSFGREDVITYAKCGLVGISRDECDEFEAYVKTWRLNGASFYTDDLWNMCSTGYSGQKRPDEAELLTRINSTREKLIRPLLAFKENISAATTVREHATALIDFLLLLKLEEQLNTGSERLSLLGEHEQSDDNSRLWELICDTLDTLVEINGDLPASSDSFLGQLKLLFSAGEFGKIPSYSDRVTIGSADMLRLRDKKHIYIIGANADELPSTQSDSGYFSERDKSLLNSLGLPLKPEAEMKNARELFIINRALCYASESVTVLYSTTNARFKPIEPSSIIKRITELTGGVVRPERISSLSVSDRIYSPETALRESETTAGGGYAAIRSSLKKTGHSQRLTIGEGDITNGNITLGDAVCRQLYKNNINLTQSKLDRFSSCPLSYFCRYTASLAEEKTAEITSAGIGTFIHAILEYFFTELGSLGINPGELSKDSRREITLRAAKRYISSLGENPTDPSPITGIKLKRLCRAAMPLVDGLCEELAASDFKPKFFELPISAKVKNSPDPIEFYSENGHKVSIGGIIDRVDTYESDGKIYVRVIDYKTGQKSFSPEDMSEGKNLQMFLYLDSIVKSENKEFLERIGADRGELVPAGVIYLKTSVGDVKVSHSDDELALRAISEGQTREGMILDDGGVIEAMNIKYTPVNNSRRPGEIDAAKTKYLFTKDGFEKIMDVVYSSAAKVADRIASGCAEAAPRADKGGYAPCDYCEFKPFCRKIPGK